MKKICVCLLFIMSTIIYGKVSPLSNLKNLEFKVDEKVKINNKEREKKYSVIFDIPNKVKKEMIFPEINKGEIYIYNKNKKMTYLPVFDEYRETEVDGEENQIIQAVNKIIKLEKTDKKFKDKYLKKEEQVIFLDENTKVILKDYKEVGTYILPAKIKIEDSFNNVEAEITLNEIKVNQDIEDGTFILKKGRIK